MDKISIYVPTSVLLGVLIGGAFGGGALPERHIQGTKITCPVKRFSTGNAINVKHNVLIHLLLKQVK